MAEALLPSLLPWAERAGARLVARGETVAVAESSAGGLVSAALLAVPGASRFFVAGGVIYTAQARDALLGLGPDSMRGLRSASEPYALLLARTLRQRTGAAWGLAETGAAGPAGNRYGDPAGHTCLALSGPSGERSRMLRTGSAERTGNMLAFAAAALALLEAAVQDGAAQDGAAQDGAPTP